MTAVGYLKTHEKSSCFGCEACVQICPHSAISMVPDEDGFRYPQVDALLCTDCGACLSVCPFDRPPERFTGQQTAFGGHHGDDSVLRESTSGGAFSAIAGEWIAGGGVVFGAVADGLSVYHKAARTVAEASRFRSSKYAQSVIGSCYKEVRHMLAGGTRVLFSGTPCQIAGLRAFLGDRDTSGLLTVEVICEGVPSPNYMRSLDSHLKSRFSSGIGSLNYRFKDGKRWDFEVMKITLQNGKQLKKDRWFNPFWKLWLSHLMSRPSCYGCPFACRDRCADISLGDLWGVHIYCPELYADNAGASLVVCSTDKGRRALENTPMVGHPLDFESAVKYQSPLRGPIAKHPKSAVFLNDLRTLDYVLLIKKWYSGPSLRLLWSKYVWGNRPKVRLMKLSGRLRSAPPLQVLSKKDENDA